MTELFVFFMVHLQQFIHVLSGVAQSRHLMLSAELAFGFEPVVEEVGSCFDDFEILKRDVVRALGLVVGVDLLQFLVKKVGKAVQTVGIYGNVLLHSGFHLPEEAERHIQKH